MDELKTMIKTIPRKGRIAIVIVVAVGIVAAAVGLGVAVGGGGGGAGGGGGDTISNPLRGVANSVNATDNTELDDFITCDAPATTMPNIGFLLSGYDIMEGNPSQTDASNDPGFRQAIFASNFCEEVTTQDLRYDVPDGVLVRSCSGSCRLDFSSTEIESTREYSQNLEVRAKVSGSAKKFGFKAKFSASTDFKQVQEEFTASSSTVIQSEVSCCAYEAQLLTFSRPNYHPTFLKGLWSLPEEYDEIIYAKFIESFGTHYVKKTVMGALFGEQSFMSEEDRQLFKDESLNVEVAASASGFGVSGAAEAEVQTDNSLAEKFKSRTFNRAVYSRGSPPPADGKQATWVNSVIDSPSPISVELDRIDELDLPVGQAVLANLERAIDGYCQMLADAGAIATCDPLDEPDEIAIACQSLADEREIEACPETRFSDYTVPIEGSKEADVASVAKPPKSCAAGEFLTDIRVRSERTFGIGLTNLEMTCSDGEVMFATDNGLGVLQDVVSCTEGFDALRGVGNEHKRGQLIGRYHTSNLDTSCENNPAFVRSKGQTFSDSKVTPTIFCGGDEQVVGIQVEETADQDEGIVKIRFVCRIPSEGRVDNSEELSDAIGDFLDSIFDDEP